MNAKRILPWENRLDDTLVAATCVGLYFPIDIGWRFFGATQEWHPSDTLDAAIDACEADYISRCTEFLRVAGPGECVVKVEDAIEMATTICALCNKAGLCPGSRMIPTTLCIVSRLCAAIDAARGSK